MSRTLTQDRHEAQPPAPLPRSEPSAKVRPEAQVGESVWRRSTLRVACVGSILAFLALPPADLWWLAWVAPVPWLWLVQRPELLTRRPYLKLWMAGCLFWLLSVHWLRLPHPATSLGWIALSAYLACYLPLLVAVSRVGVHRLRLPLWSVAPVVFAGLELAQGRVLTGFLMGCLAHSQAHWPLVAQLADLGGAYAISALLMLVAAAITTAVAPLPGQRRWLGPAVGAAAATLTLAYGGYRLAEYDRLAVAEGPRVGLIQGNTLATWKQEPDRQRRIMEDYRRLSLQAVAQAEAAGKPLDVVIWPETMFRTPLVMLDPEYQVPPGMTREQYTSAARSDLKSLAAQLGVPILVGIDRVYYKPDGPGGEFRYDNYNSSALVDREGEVQATYDKTHLVIFGEYIPFADYFPVLYSWTPLTGGAEHGAGAVAFDLEGFRYSPNICYETAVPHVIQAQVKSLADEGKKPDVLVNLTNDAWYWGSSELDQHLACGVFRAIETRTPLVVAANGGLSAVVDSSGRILRESPRMQEHVIVERVPLDPRRSPYVAVGDLFAGTCLALTGAVAVYGWSRRRHPVPT